jgi:VIT1/CCC1 family predicted Fe2+/Mn2+ transporter/rubrerythrin
MKDKEEEPVADIPKSEGAASPKLRAALERNWRAEMEGAQTYQYMAEREQDARRRAVLLQLADAEARHAARWAERLRDLGGVVPNKPPPRASWITPAMPTEVALRRLENEEEEHIRIYEQQARELNDQPSIDIIHQAVADERQHAGALRAMTAAAPSARSRLDVILHRESWHTRTGSWIGDAIYGANDGLGAVFGIVSGVAGATGNSSHFVLLAGLAGAFASALSMGSGAYLSTKSEGEIHQAEIARERGEVEEHPEEEIEELELFYQLKGLTPEEAHALVQRLAQNQPSLVAALAQEELGLSEERVPNPLIAAVSASVSTFLGAMVPVLPFFFLGGITAVIVAAIVSLAAHFAVGAAKTLVTGRSIWVSGGEMTIVGAAEGLITYLIGTLVSPLGPAG